MQFEIRCKKSKYKVYGIDRNIWNKYFAGRTLVFDTKDIMCSTDIDSNDAHFHYYFPSLHTFKSNFRLVTEYDRQAMEYWLIYPQYKRRVQ